MAEEISTDPVKEANDGVREPRSRRIRYTDDVEDQTRGRQNRTRSRSRDSLSIRSVSRRRTVEAKVVLPIEYRTLSFNIDDAKRQDAKAPKPVDEKTADYLERDWHKISVNEAYQRLSTSPQQGLSSDQVQRRLKEYGTNTLTPPPSGRLRKILLYFFGGFGSILLAGSILVFIAWRPLGDPPAVANLALGIVLAIVFFIQAVFNFWQDWSTSRVMASIKNMLPDQCLVIRDGSHQEVDGTQLVPGDLLCVRIGTKLPADVRFVHVSSDAKFDRSVLTGESIPVRATVESTNDNYLETHCIGMAGTHCTSGEATGVVVATGDRSVFGELAKLTSTPKTGFTNLEKEIYYFVATIVGIMVTMIIVVIAVWASWLRKDHPDWISVPLLIVDCVSVAIAFIPEGLPIAVTSSLTIVANIMRKNQVLCKSLKTVETLGSVSVICSDKTGTLTTNKMTVTQYLLGDESRSAQSAAEAIDERDALNMASSTDGLHELAFVGGLCNAGEFDPTDNRKNLSERTIIGDATDQAVLRFSAGQVDVKALRQQWSSVFKLPFNSKNKFMINVLKNEAATKKLEVDNYQNRASMTIKGAPDILLSRCLRYVAVDGIDQDLSESHRRFVEQIKDMWSRDARRVILLAKKSINLNPSQSINSADFEANILREAGAGLTLIGLIGIVDPPRPEIPEVIRTLRTAGVKVFMVTGDAKLTAQAIATECGIITPSESIANVDLLAEPKRQQVWVGTGEGLHSAATSIMPSSIVLSGGDLATLDDEDWNKVAQYDEIVFARTTPEQKLRIVKELQARGEVVGMTGDGVNDAPSLKAADIGIAMGSGSDIAIEAADMVLLDSFAAIVEAVKYGRVVFDNLKKTICYLLPAGSFSEFWPVMTNVLFGLPQILSSFLMIIICCFTDCAAAIAIAYEQPEADVMLLTPRNPKKDHLVNWKLILQAYGFIGVLETTASFAMSYWYAQRRGVTFSSQWFGFGSTPDNMTSDEYTAIMNTASSIYFVTLVVMQWFTLMALRTRRLSFLQHPPLFRRSTRNWYLFPAIVFAMLIAIFFLYVPKFQEKLSTAVVPVAHWFLPMAFGLAILLLDEGRKFLTRRYPKSLIARIAW